MHMTSLNLCLLKTPEAKHMWTEVELKMHVYPLINIANSVMFLLEAAGSNFRLFFSFCLYRLLHGCLLFIMAQRHLSVLLTGCVYRVCDIY